MLVKIPPQHAQQLQQLDLLLRREVSQAIEAPPGNASEVLDKLSAIAAQQINGETTLELAVHARRRVLAAQWEYLSRQASPAHLIRRVIDEFDVIGYDQPAIWADIRLELAAQHERESNHKEAQAIRAQVREKTRRIVSELQLLKHVQG